MTSFQLVFQRDGKPPWSEFRKSSFENEPHIDGRRVVDGDTFSIRGVDWVVRRQDIANEPRFVCTPVGQPMDTP